MFDKQQEFLSQIEENKGIIYKIARMYMDAKEDQDDLYQEICIQLWQSYSSFKGKSKFSTWMYRVALNTALVFVKRDKRRMDRYSIEDRFEQVDEQYSGKEDEQIGVLYKAVQELNTIEKALIFLFLEGQSHQQIGEHLGISEGNARVRLMRTKNKLQLIVKKIGYEF